MSQDRLARIEDKIDLLTGVVGQIKADVSVLKTDVAVLKTDVAVLKTDVAGLKGDVAGLKGDVSDLKLGQERFRGDLVDLGNQMRTLNNDVIARIKAAAEDDSLKTEMHRRFDEVMRSIADHSIPGDAADRYFARKINEHDIRLDALERREQ